VIYSWSFPSLIRLTLYTGNMEPGTNLPVLNSPDECLSSGELVCDLLKVIGKTGSVGTKIGPGSCV
jgi:hypothetical protein